MQINPTGYHQQVRPGAASLMAARQTKEGENYAIIILLCHFYSQSGPLRD